MDSRVSAYFATLAQLTREAQATDRGGNTLSLDEVLLRFGENARTCHQAGSKLMFVGNGGSAAIASHMAIDFSKNGGMRATAFNDGAALTCLGNDLGYENVFAKQIEMHGQSGDLLIAVSSSGNSANVLAAVAAARSKGCGVFTLSGFGPDNALRKLGDYNLYVPSKEYGFVEVAHLALVHGALDLAMGWGDEGPALRRASA